VQGTLYSGMPLHSARARPWQGWAAPSTNASPLMAQPGWPAQAHLQTPSWFASVQMSTGAGPPGPAECAAHCRTQRGPEHSAAAYSLQTSPAHGMMMPQVSAQQRDPRQAGTDPGFAQAAGAVNPADSGRRPLPAGAFTSAPSCPGQLGSLPGTHVAVDQPRQLHSGLPVSGPRLHSRAFATGCDASAKRQRADKDTAPPSLSHTPAWAVAQPVPPLAPHGPTTSGAPQAGVRPNEPVSQAIGDTTRGQHGTVAAATGQLSLSSVDVAKLQKQAETGKLSAEGKALLASHWLFADNGPPRGGMPSRRGRGLPTRKEDTRAFQIARKQSDKKAQRTTPVQATAPVGSTLFTSSCGLVASGAEVASGHAALQAPSPEVPQQPEQHAPWQAPAHGSAACSHIVAVMSGAASGMAVAVAMGEEAAQGANDENQDSNHPPQTLGAGRAQGSHVRMPAATHALRRQRFSCPRPARGSAARASFAASESAARGAHAVAESVPGRGGAPAAGMVASGWATAQGHGVLVSATALQRARTQHATRISMDRGEE
jgi:hypothetical protein